ncbi:phytoene/squalene synthase family protein [Haliangium sp.]|uniref:phytoene/squalene synthase family protein n=1 Tax=Haliangium sp. TaxID=2663208 RepID=UPI003D147B92
MSFWRKLSTRSQSNLYFALVFLDRRRRTAIRDVYRFVRAADDAADAFGDPAENARRLRAWRHELDQVYGDRARHRTSRRLARVVRRYGLPRRHFDTVLDGLERDIHPRQLANWAEVEAYCEAVAVPVAYLCLSILDATGLEAERYARDVGVALQVANILRDVAEDAARGRIYLPADELAAAGVTPTEILARRASPGLARVCRRQAGRARALITHARANLDPDARRRLRVPEIWADVYLALLDQLEALDFDVFRRPPYLHRRRKLAVALRRRLAR